jgi:hypothetical protein
VHRHVVAAGKPVLTPVSWYIDLGLARAINAFFASPPWVAAFVRSLAERAQGKGCWSTAERGRLKGAFTRFVGGGGDNGVGASGTQRGGGGGGGGGGTSGSRGGQPNGGGGGAGSGSSGGGAPPAFESDATITCEVLLDWAQPYNSAQHSTGVLVIRCSSLSPLDKCRDWNLQVIAIFPGPQAPKNMDGLLRTTADAFRAGALQGGIKLESPVHYTLNGRRHCITKVVPVLSGILADSQVGTWLTCVCSARFALRT